MARSKNELKQYAINEAEKYVKEHGYVNVNWLIRQKLSMNVKNTFINSVSAHLTNSGKYRKEPLSKMEYRIVLDPLGVSKRQYNFRTLYLPLIAIVIGIILTLITIHFTGSHNK